MARGMTRQVVALGMVLGSLATVTVGDTVTASDDAGDRAARIVEVRTAREAPAGRKADGVTIRAVSNRKPRFVSGGQVLVRIGLPGRLTISDARITNNGERIRPHFERSANGTWIGIISGMVLGTNRIQVEVRTPSGVERATLPVVNHRRRGPVFSGPQQRPFFCETQAFGLDPAEGPYCEAPTEVSYQYRTTAGRFAPLSDPTSPPADAATVTVRERELPYVVRIERGTINRAVYEVAGIYSGQPQPLAGDRGWNSKLVYTFGGGCNGGYHQGAGTGGVVNDLFLSRGYVVASSSLNVLNNNCSPIISAEAAMMVKEHVLETYGPAYHTIGWGGSGGAIQQYDIADAYPQIVDGILPSISFPDPFSTLGPVVDCGLLNDFFEATDVAYSAAQQRTIKGFRDPNTCLAWELSFFNRITATGSCDPAIPVAVRWDAETNPDGVRCSAAEQVANQLGRDPRTGFVRSVLDNVGVQYGLRALQRGTITPAQFIELNRGIGGVDYTGELVDERAVADRAALGRAYAADLVNSGGLGLAQTPVIDLRNYRDAGPDIHTAEWSYVMRQRMIRQGTVGNQVILEFGSNSSDAAATYALGAMDQWLTNIADDAGPGTPGDKIVRNRPRGLGDGCYLANGRRIREELSYRGSGQCPELYPIFSNPRLVAGEPLARNALKCQLAPIDFSTYGATFSRAQRAELRSVFPNGVCDHSRPSVGERPPEGAWIDYSDG